MRLMALFCFALAFIAGTPTRVMADETSGKDYGAMSIPAKITEYSRLNSTTTVTGTVALTDLNACSHPGVTCKNFVAGTPLSAKAVCTGDAKNGGWSATSITGQCFSSITVCYGTDTANPFCVDITGSPANLSDVGFTASTLCTNPDPDKNFCVMNYMPGALQGVSEANGLKSPYGLTGATGDDMFRINDGGHGFLEYAAIGSIGDAYRLKYVTRAGGPAQGLVIPSGPASTFSDFKQFMDHHPASVSVENACYPVTISLCPLEPVLPPVAGACGSSNGGKFSEVPAAGLCNVGKSSVVAGGQKGPWSWSCPGYEGGATANCTATYQPKPVNGQCGPANGGSYASGPTSGFCSSGLVTLASGSHPWNWSCLGKNGGTTASCYALMPGAPSEGHWVQQLVMGWEWGAFGLFKITGSLNPPGIVQLFNYDFVPLSQAEAPLMIYRPNCTASGACYGNGLGVNLCPITNLSQSCLSFKGMKDLHTINIKHNWELFVITTNAAQMAAWMNDEF